MDKNVFSISIPKEEDPGTHLLILQRASGPFGGGSTTTMWIDQLFYDRSNRYYVAKSCGKDIALFPGTAGFLVVAREKVEQMTQEQAFRRDVEEEKKTLALRKELYPEEVQEPASAPDLGVAALHTGLYA